MTRKRSTRKPRPATPPMLVNRGLMDDELQLRERMVVEAFAGGWASTEHFDELADMRNVLTLADAYKLDKEAQAMCDAMRIPLANLRERHAKTGRLGVTGDELQMLRAFVEFYRDWWMRRPVNLYLGACDSLNLAHEMGVVKEAA
jgi:hypothetical protein